MTVRIPVGMTQPIAEFLRDFVNADPENAEATISLPHNRPDEYAVVARLDAPSPAPFCGCFIGAAAWCHAEKVGDVVRADDYFNLSFGGGSWDAGDYMQRVLSLPACGFAGWCDTTRNDRLAVRYTRALLNDLAVKAEG